MVVLVIGNTPNVHFEYWEVPVAGTAVDILNAHFEYLVMALLVAVAVAAVVLVVGNNTASVVGNNIDAGVAVGKSVDMYVAVPYSVELAYQPSLMMILTIVLLLLNFSLQVLMNC
jgi:hypothetical protein